MADDPTDPDATTDTDQGEPSAGDDTDTLGDAGKAAIRRERQARKQAEAALRTAEDALTAAKADGLSAIETARAEARTEARKEVLAEANGRIIHAEVKAAAAGKLRRPEYATRLLDLTTFTVADDGTVDTKAIASAIDELIANDPELAVTGAPGPLPGGGARPTSGSSMDDAIRRAAGRR